MKQITLQEAKHIAKYHIKSGPFTEKDIDILSFLIFDLSEYMLNKEGIVCKN